MNIVLLIQHTMKTKEEIQSVKSVVEIIDYTEQLKEHIKTLNYEWIQKHHHIEEGDVRSLSNPKEEILDKGGMIYYAQHDNKIVGTVSLLKITDEEYELGKMAVTESAQGLGIGKILMEHCIKISEELKIKRLCLYSNTKLKPAIHLYQKYGFVEVPLEPGHYERANIKMEKAFIL